MLYDRTKKIVRVPTAKWKLPRSSPRKGGQTARKRIGLGQERMMTGGD